MRREKQTHSRWKMNILFSILVLPIILLTGNSCEKDTPPDTPDKPGKDSTINEIPFANVPAIDEIVMYEVNFLAFSPEGTIAGVTPRLDSLKNLGINVIWLMPLHPIGEINSVNSPYSVQNYREVNPNLGTLNDLKTLVRKAHDRDMAVIIDWVANHTAWDNPWIENKDWYSQDNNGEIIAPPGTNWADVADLDFSNAEMRQAMIEAMQYWVTTANIDGFRCDAAD